MPPTEGRSKGSFVRPRDREGPAHAPSYVPLTQPSAEGDVPHRGSDPSYLSRKTLAASSAASLV